MNKYNIDPIEHTFSKLKNMEEYVEDSVWGEINIALDKKERSKKRLILLFFSVVAILGIGIFENHKHNSPVNNPIVSNKVNSADIKTERSNPLVSPYNSISENKSKVIQVDKEEVNYISTTILTRTTEFNNFEQKGEKIELTKDYPLLAPENPFDIQLRAFKLPEINFTFNKIHLQNTQKTMKLQKTGKFINSIDGVIKTGYFVNANSEFAASNKTLATGFKVVHNFNNKLKFSIGSNLEVLQLNGLHFKNEPYLYKSDSILSINRESEIFYFYIYDTAIKKTTEKIQTNLVQITVPIEIRKQIYTNNTICLETTAEAEIAYTLSKLQKPKTANTNEYYDLLLPEQRFNIRLGLGGRLNYKLSNYNSIYISPQLTYSMGKLSRTQVNYSINPVILNISAGYSYFFN